MDTKQASQSPTRAKCIQRLEKLHRGEIAAVTTYGQAIKKAGAATGALSVIRDEHRSAATQIGARIVSLGGKTPTDDGTPWEAFAQAIEGAATLLGNRAALEALKLGENHGVDQYADAMGDANLDVESRAVLDGAIARQKKHIAAIDQLAQAK